MSIPKELRELKLDDKVYKAFDEKFINEIIIFCYDGGWSCNLKYKNNDIEFAKKFRKPTLKELIIEIQEFLTKLKKLNI